MGEQTFSVLEIPAVHLNGTSGDALLEQVLEAARAAQALLNALWNAAPNGRDYYVKDPGALRRAEAEHRSRVERVKSVLMELERISEGIAEQNDQRRR